MLLIHLRGTAKGDHEVGRPDFSPTRTGWSGQPVFLLPRAYAGFAEHKGNGHPFSWHMGVAVFWGPPQNGFGCPLGFPLKPINKTGPFCQGPELVAKGKPGEPLGQ